MEPLLHYAFQKMVGTLHKMNRVLHFPDRWPLNRLLHYCSWNTLVDLWQFSISPGPREAFLKSIALCIITVLATDKQIVGYLYLILFYNRFYLDSVSKAYKTFATTFIPVILPSRSRPIALAITEFTLFSMLQVNVEYSEIAWNFIIAFLSHLGLKVSVGSLVLLYTLLTTGQLDCLPTSELCAILG